MVDTRIATAAALALSAAVGPAWAQAAQRGWVSAHGTDAVGRRAPTAPCHSFQIAAGGETPTGYGMATPTKALTYGGVLEPAY
jgi:hypothetical protein